VPDNGPSTHVVYWQYMPPWEYLVGAAIGGGISAAIALWWARRHRWPWPELEELQEQMTQLAHRNKMLQGRLNQVAPPREGTGVAIDSSAGAQVAPVSRADLLREVLRRKGGS